MDESHDIIDRLDHHDPSDHKDPLDHALKKLLGLNYLFPYQRLVITNILEAAESRGITVNWHGDDNSVPDAKCSFPDSKSPLADPQSPILSPYIYEDRDSLAYQIVILPTGAGKSLCFQLPAMLLPGPTLVIYPILSLMADQERRLKEKNFFPVLLRGGQTTEERNAIWNKIRSGESRFIIANPEVLLTPQVLEKLESIKLLHLVIDEAHCTCEWGESFRPSYLEINKIIRAASPALVTAFTATASAPVLEKIEKYIFNQSVRRIIGNPDRSNICYSACGAALKDLAVRDLLLANKKPAIVFCSSRNGCETLSRRLRNDLDDKEIRFYHAGLSREEKDNIEKWFFGNPYGTLITTCAYGMGVDKPDIRTVIHRDCPPSVEAYLQESGRAGRDGKASKAIFIWGPEDENSLSRAKNPSSRFRVEELLGYARQTQICRRDYLLKLLDYTADRDCPETDCCDVCTGIARAQLREEDSIKNFIKRNLRSYSIGEAASHIDTIEKLNCSEKEAGELLQFLISSQKLKVYKNPLWRNKLGLVK